MSRNRRQSKKQRNRLNTEKKKTLQKIPLTVSGLLKRFALKGLQKIPLTVSGLLKRFALKGKI